MHRAKNLIVVVVIIIIIIIIIIGHNVGVILR
jgi:hypothetical protein